MIDKKYIELMNKAIDGVATKSEQERLRSYLSVNSEAQNFYNDLSRTSELLNKIPKVEPSPNIKKYVMNSIDLTRYSVSPKTNKFKSLVSRLLVKPSPKLAYAFALGILIGILVYSVFLENVLLKRGVEATDFYGTIGIVKKADFKTITSIPIGFTEVKGTIDVKKLEDIVVIETDLSALKETEIQFEYDESHLQFSHFNSGSQAKVNFDSGENYIRASWSGNNQFNLFFTQVSADGKPIILKLSVAGELRFTQDILL